MSEDSNEIPLKYEFTRSDRPLVGAAIVLLDKVIKSGMLSPTQLVSIAKLFHVYCRLPRITPGLEIKVTITGPRNKFGDVETYYWWDVGVQDEMLEISSGGHFYRPSSGGDTFSIMRWIISPGYDAEFDDYLGNLSIVPDACSFEEGVSNVDFSTKSYGINVEDSDNEWLEDDDGCEIEDDDESEMLGDEAETWVITPIDDSDNRLAALIKTNEINEHEAQFAYGAESCDSCGCSLEDRGLYVDGKIRTSIAWANLCAPCFEKHGAGIGWGVGQIYARQINNDWRLVAGFQRS